MWIRPDQPATGALQPGCGDARARPAVRARRPCPARATPPPRSPEPAGESGPPVLASRQRAASSRAAGASRPEPGAADSTAVPIRTGSRTPPERPQPLQGRQRRGPALEVAPGRAGQRGRTQRRHGSGARQPGGLVDRGHPDHEEPERAGQPDHDDRPVGPRDEGPDLAGREHGPGQDETGGGGRDGTPARPTSSASAAATTPNPRPSSTASPAVARSNRRRRSVNSRSSSFLRSKYSSLAQSAQAVSVGSARNRANSAAGSCRAPVSSREREQRVDADHARSPLRPPRPRGRARAVPRPAAARPRWAPGASPRNRYIRRV